MDFFLLHLIEGQESLHGLELHTCLKGFGVATRCTLNGSNESQAIVMQLLCSTNRSKVGISTHNTICSKQRQYNIYRKLSSLFPSTSFLEPVRFMPLTSLSRSITPLLPHAAF
jgi:hypothetical protein